MADKKTQMEKIREAYVKAQANKGEDRVTPSDIERMQNFMKNKDKIKFPPKKNKKPEILRDTGFLCLKMKERIFQCLKKVHQQ
jgi:hypothetical protein